MKPVTLSDLSNEELRGKNSLYKFAWRVEAMPIISGVASPLTGTYRLPPLNVEALTLPMPQQSVTEAVVSATTVYFADKHQIDQFNMTVKEDEYLSSLKYFTAWNHNIQNPYTGGFYLPSRYKKDIPVMLFDNQGREVMRAKLKGVWPNTIQQFELDNTDDKHKLNVSLSVDALVPEFLK